MARTTIPAELVAINAIQGTLIADNAITAVHIATNAVSGTLVADNAITSTHIAQNNVTATQILQNTITVTQIADSAVETAKINNDAVTQAKIADDAVGPDQLAANAVVTGSIANGTIIEADMADNAVTLAKMASLARGKIIVGDSAGDPSALAIGSNGTVLKSDGTDVSWGAAAGGVDGIVSSADATAITIDSSENVGIGTSSPADKLHVAGDFLLENGAPEIHLGPTSASHYNWKIAAQDTVNKGFEIASGTQSSGTGAPLDTYTARFVIEADTGSVGIGTSSPSTDLHIKSTDQNALTVETDTAVNQIHLSNSTNSPTYITQDSYVLKLKADDNGWGGTASGIHFRVKNAEYARVTPKGLSIGDTDGDYENRNGSEGLHVKRGGILMNGHAGDANMSSDTNGNQWTYHGQGGRGGSFTSVYFSIPNPNGGASGQGYGGFSVEFYIAGYNGKYHSGHYSGYTNNSIVQSASAFYATSGSSSIAAVSVGSQGFKITVSFPSMTHPTAKFIVNKGGHGLNTAYTDMSGAQIGWA